MTYIPDPMVLVIGMCLGAVIATMLMVAASYIDYRRNKVPKYTGICDTKEERSELVKLVHENNGIVTDISKHNDKYKIQYECTEGQQVAIAMAWMF